jgi:hypothetical protein
LTEDGKSWKKLEKVGKSSPETEKVGVQWIAKLGRVGETIVR